MSWTLYSLVPFTSLSIIIIIVIFIILLDSSRGSGNVRGTLHILAYLLHA